MRYTKCAKCKNYVPNVMTAICCDCDGICNYAGKQLTNADYIRAMSDEKLADFIQHVRTNTLLGEALGVSTTRDEDLEFLRKPAKDGEDE